MRTDHTVRGRLRARTVRLRKPEVDYRSFRPHLCNTPEFSHLKLLLFWPLFGLAFFLLEQVNRTGFTVMHCRLDDWIPFCEYFVIPYIVWFFYLLGMHVYTLLYDVETFRRMMWFITLTFTLSLVIFVLFPSRQTMRPLVFPRENFCTDLVRFFYRIDTSTNVCPSLHVVGSIAVYAASRHARGLQSTGWHIVFGAVTLLICMSAVFLKQHSLLDVLAGVVLCLCVYPLCFGGQPAEEPTRRLRQRLKNRA